MINIDLKKYKHIFIQANTFLKKKTFQDSSVVYVLSFIPHNCTYNVNAIKTHALHNQFLYSKPMF